MVTKLFLFFDKAELLLLKLIHLFAGEVLLVKKLEIEETKTTQYSTFKTDIKKWAQFFQFPTFLLTKSLREGNLFCGLPLLTETVYCSRLYGMQSRLKSFQIILVHFSAIFHNLCRPKEFTCHRVFSKQSKTFRRFCFIM